MINSNVSLIRFENVSKSFRKHIVCYYIDRCDLWEFIHEINSGISHVIHQFFPAGTTFTQLYVLSITSLDCATVNSHTIVN
jgi:hypothetical protein